MVRNYKEYRINYISFQSDCNRDEIYVIPPEKLLTRLEVYNSLGVTAPQIDLQSEKRYNVTGECGSNSVIF